MPDEIGRLFPMKFGGRTKLFAASVVIIISVGLVCGLYFQRQLRRSSELRMTAQLWHYAQIVRETLEDSSEGVSPATVPSLTRTLARALDVRITVIAPDGRLLADSSGLSAKPDEAAENYLHYPEVAAAHTYGKGQSQRYSTAAQTELVFAALQFKHPGGKGVVRVAESVDSIGDEIAHLRILLWIAGLSGLGVAILLVVLASRFMSRALRELADSARTIASGDARRRIEVSGSDELGLLAGSVNRMADDIEKTVAALATERARFKAVLEGMNDAVVTLDRDRHITLINPEALALLELSEPPIGQPFIDYVRAPDIHTMLAEPIEANSCEFDLPGLSTRRVLARITPQRDDSGCIIVMHDVTSIRQLETVRRDFVANVSHELRTPVSIIRANAETLLGGAIIDPIYGQRLLEALSRNAERLSRLVDDLLDLSRLEANRYRLERDTITVTSAVQQAAASVERAAQAKAICLEFDVDSALRVNVDNNALDQILVNYLDNAIKYTPDGGRVRVSARPELQAKDTRIRIDVTDNGPGIAPQHRKRIFERFYRIDPGRSRNMGGTGLGLSIVKHLADALGGDAGMEPAEPHGSTFWVSLPSS